MRGLESLGQTEDSYGALLVPVMLGKLPAEAKRNITRGHGSTDWNLGDLRRAIWTELNIMDAGNSTYITMEEMQISTMLTNTRPSVTHTARSSETDQSRKNKCPYCKGDHYANGCATVTDHEERMRIVKRDRLCFNCLKRHKVSKCKSKQTCKCCHKRHHTSLCYKKRDENTETQRKASTERQTTQLHSSLTEERKDVLLKTAVAPVHGRDICTSANILFDEGAQRTFITEEFAREINIQLTGKESVQLSGFGDSERRVRNFDTGSLIVEAMNGETVPINVMVVPEIAVPITTFAVYIKRMEYLQGLKLAHPSMKDDVFNISLLIGADHYWDFVENHTVRGKGPTAVQSKLGYLLSGPLIGTTSTCLATTSMLHVTLSHKEEEYDQEEIWEIENVRAEGKQKPEVTARTGNSESMSHLPLRKDLAAVNIHVGEAERSRERSENDNYRSLNMSEYSGLQEFHRAHGRNNQTVNVDDVVHIQDDNRRVRWKSGITQRLISGNEGLTANRGVTNSRRTDYEPPDLNAVPTGTVTL